MKKKIFGIPGSKIKFYKLFAVFNNTVSDEIHIEIGGKACNWAHKLHRKCQDAIVIDIDVFIEIIQGPLNSLRVNEFSIVHCFLSQNQFSFLFWIPSIIIKRNNLLQIDRIE